METKGGHGAHVLAVPYPSQGHINPMLQFSKHLASTKSIKATFAITNFISTTLQPIPDRHLSFATFSDGYDEGGFSQAESIAAYLNRLESAGSYTLAKLVESHTTTSHPITCILYDAFMPWVLEIAKRYGLLGATFFTQACTVNYMYYKIYKGVLTLPLTLLPLKFQGLPEMDVEDMPGFVAAPETYPAYFEMVLRQNCNVDKADFVLVNTFYDLEKETVDAMAKLFPLLTIGPTVPSKYLDKKMENDQDYGLNLYHLDSTLCTNWLSTKPPRSVVYVSFGSMACLSKHQMDELAWGLMGSNHYFLWVVRESETVKLPKNFIELTRDHGLVVEWTPQLEVLANEATGCFFTHCGWNSTQEALVLGVPMVGMPLWTDQPTDAKLIQDVWKVGVRVKANENGIFSKEEIIARIKEVTDGERSQEIRKNAKKWKQLANNAISQGGSTYKNIDKFVSRIVSNGQ